MKKLLLFILISTGTFGYSQNNEAFVDSMVSQFINQLSDPSGAVFSRKNYCDGKIEMFQMPDGKMCSSASTYYSVYVFWKEDEISNVKKFDNCGDFEAVVIETDINERVTGLMEILRNEEVQPYKAANPDKSPFRNMKVEDCQKQYIFKRGTETFERSFKEFDLGNDSNSPNVNAASNNALELIILDKELNKIISGLEGEGKFRRGNRE